MLSKKKLEDGLFEIFLPDLKEIPDSDDRVRIESTTRNMSEKLAQLIFEFVSEAQIDLVNTESSNSVRPEEIRRSKLR